MKIPHKNVPEHVARNPIARQMAFLKMRDFATEMRALTYGMDEGIEHRNYVVPVSEFLTMVYLGADHDKILTHENIAEPVERINQAIALLLECSNNDFLWKKAYADPLSDALFCAQEITKLLTPEAINRAWMMVHAPDKLANIDRLKRSKKGKKRK
jgi:hypothetical protein